MGKEEIVSNFKDKRFYKFPKFPKKEEIVSNFKDKRFYKFPKFPNESPKFPNEFPKFPNGSPSGLEKFISGLPELPTSPQDGSTVRIERLRPIEVEGSRRQVLLVGGYNLYRLPPNYYSPEEPIRRVEQDMKPFEDVVLVAPAVTVGSDGTATVIYVLYGVDSTLHILRAERYSEVVILKDKENPGMIVFSGKKLPAENKKNGGT